MEAPDPGLSMSDALRILKSDLEEVVRGHRRAQRAQTWRSCLSASFLNHRNVESALPWTSVGVLLVCVVVVWLAYAVQDAPSHWLLLQGFVILGVLLVSVSLMVWDDHRKSLENVERAEEVIQTLDRCIDTDGAWTADDFLSLHTPQSPCVTLQWTARGGQIVNLPCVFLVEGDTIYLRPGQVVLVQCKPLHGGDLDRTYKPGELFDPSTPDPSVSAPREQTPLKPAPFMVLETPFCTNLSEILAESNWRPRSVLTNQAHQTYVVWVERRLLLLVFCVVLLTNVLRLMIFGNHLGEWGDVCLSLLVQAVLPLTALVHPVLWKLVDLYGVARITSMLRRSKETQVQKSASGFESSSTVDGMNNLHENSRDVCDRFCEILRGNSGMPARNRNLVHALGNVTSFCCVDKKGLLSWPNPTVEKVFFLTSSGLDLSKITLPESELSNDSSATDPDDQDSANPSQLESSNIHDVTSDMSQPHTKFVVLDVTQDSQDHRAVTFDDPNWRSYISSLKPLGLDILLNTCNTSTTEEYTQFADHVTSASHKHEASIPVMNKRCFCELAAQIGFHDKAIEIFNTQQTLGLYRQITDMRDAALKARNFVKYKMPMPHMFSVVVKETSSGSRQLFSQGTADLLLDACSEFWNGEDLCPLADTERKRILDFYHRTSMSAYCTAFSYRPMAQTLGDEVCTKYLEVPEDAYELFPALRSPTPSRSWDTQSLESRLLNANHEYFHASLDSLPGDKHPAVINDALGCFRQQCNQIFVGMISMQYQAKQDVIDLVENLESACIRFVHFSKENELRSRVFSEKMGLEAGWNCHISLLGVPEEAGDQSQPDLSHSGSSNRASKFSSRNSTDSFQGNRSNLNRVRASEDSVRSRRLSAPAAISTDTTQVKFETTPSPIIGDYSPNHGSQDDCSHTQNNSSAHLKDDEQPNSVSQHLFQEEQDVSVDSSKDRTTDPLLPKGTEERTTIPSTGSMDSLPASSFVTENTDSVTGALGLSNRAKLPKGINNIRPHLANVDNVPLLVSLFTDCTPGTTKEMIQILQEYGEVVCCLGSSCNIHNTPIFMQADCSLSVEPIYTQTCVKHPPNTRRPGVLGPMKLSSMFHSLPCSMSFLRDDSISVVRLIALARHHCQQMRQMFLFLLMCNISVSLVHTLAGAAFLPPPLAPHHTLWVVVVILPILSLTLIGSPLDLQIIRMAQGKNVAHVSFSSVWEFVKMYCLRYVPSVVVCLLCHAMTLYSVCQRVNQRSRDDSNTTSCHVLFGHTEYPTPAQWNGWYGEYRAGLTLSQNIVLCQLVLYLSLGSMCFVYRLKQLWEVWPVTNRLWCVLTPVLLVLQVVFSTLDVVLSPVEVPVSVRDVPLVTWVLAAVWPLLLVPLHELVKRHEAKVWRRYQKRARLDFGTKLGMNSPF